MELGVERRGNARIIAVKGRIDHLNASAFHEQLIPHLQQCRGDGDGIVLDLAGLDYISSAGLRIFMMAAKQARAQGGRIAVAQMQALVQEIFEISHFHLVYEIFATTDEAATAIGRHAETAGA
jgi:anti-sigma B factor antagonist